MNKIYLLIFTVLYFFTKSNLQAQDAAYTMTATTKTITSCRSTLSSDNSCKVAGNWLYCNNTDRSYTFISSSGSIMNANLTAHVIADDFIYVYDGPSSASPLIATWTGGTGTNWSTGLNATSTGSVITIRFVSNGSNQGNISFVGGGNYSGFDILIGCKPGNCNGNPPANDSCKRAPVICNLNGYCGNTSGWYNEDNPQLEGQVSPGFTGSIENNSWINFYAGATTTTLIVTSANCLTSTSGIQGAVYASSDCSSFTPAAGGSFNQSLASGTVTLSLTGLTIGQSYFLMLDGYNGNVCDYTVTAIGNIQTLATSSSASSNTICPNQTFTVTATSGAASYSWNPAPLSTSSNTAVYNNISSTSIITTTAFGYCGSTATVALTMSVIPVTLSITSPTICSGTSTVITASGASTYTWNTGATTSSISVSPTSTTAYTVTGTSGICSASKTTTVTVTPTPTVIVTNTAICNGSSTTLSASGATSYSWNTGATTATIAASPTITTIYTVTGTTSGCSNTQTVSVTVNPIPTTTATTSGTLACSPTTVALNSTLAGVNYTWTAPAGGTLGSANTQSTSASGAAGTYTLFIQSAAGCTYSTTTSVTQNTTVPTGVSAGSNQTLTCGSSSVTLNGSVTTPTNATANWTGAIICGAGPASFTTSACAAGIYTLTVTNPANNCTATSTVQVFPSAGAPSVTANPVTNSITCTNTLVTVSITSTAVAVTYTWSGPGTILGNGTPTIVVNQSGTFNYTVTSTISGCSTSGSQIVLQNTTPPTTTANVTGTISCLTTTVNLNSTLAGMNYTWTAPAGSSVSSGTNTQNAIGSGPGTYSLTVFNSTNGCSYNTTAIATQNTTPPTLTLSPMSFTVTCATPTVQLIATTTDTDVSYAWTTNGSLSSSVISNPVATGSGTYNIIITNTLTGCQANQTATVTQNTTPPTLTLSPMSSTLTCATTTVQLTATSTDTDVSYAWTNTGGSLSNSTIANPIANGAGTYSVVVTNTINGCTATLTSTISPSSGSPTLTISSTALTVDCINTSQSVTVTSTPSTNVVYNWNITPFSASADSSQATFTNSSTNTITYICTVTNTLSGCSSPVQVTITTNTAVPTITISPNQVLTCNSPSVTISTTVNPVSTYTWVNTSGVIAGQNIGTLLVNSPDTYTVNITSSVNGCTNTASSTITSNASTPSATIIATSSNSVITCLNTSVTLSVNVTPIAGYTYTWSTSSNNTSISASTAGSYSVLVYNSTTGCTTTAQYTVSSNTTVPNITASNTVIPCGSNSVSVVSTSTDVVTYNWSTSNGNIITNGSSTAVVGSAGNYTVTATNAANGCTNTAIANVTQTNITALFTANPTSGTAPLGVNFTNQSTGATGYVWTFGDTNNNTAVTTDANHTYSTTGTYTVILTAMNGTCTSSYSVTIDVFSASTVIIPNVFTPNGDGYNDVFKITTNGVKDITCDIFNRWGTKIHTISSVSDSWDGSGSVDGTYFYVLKATGYDGKEFNEKGFISLFK